MKAILVYKQLVPVIKLVKFELLNAGYDVRLVKRSSLKGNVKADLIVPVGGDGTVLSVVPFAGNVPILAVNALPNRSVGFFCAVTVDALPALLNKISNNKIKYTALPLLEAYVGKRKLARPALNEYLLTSKNPAHTSKYELIIGNKSEKQRSSGVWVSAGPGSTAVISLAGGANLPTNSDRLQYVVREPCPYADEQYKLLKGILKEEHLISAISDLEKGMIYPDGASPGFPWPKGETVTIAISKQRLNIYLLK